MAEAATALRRDPVALSAPVRAALREAEWPKNIRQLRSACQWLAAMTDGEIADLHNLPPDFGEAAGPSDDSFLLLAQRALDEAGGNKSRAAKALGIRRETLHRVIKRAARSIGS
jgi:transcriptional regulator of acetoin/glycerol metabolism